MVLKKSIALVYGLRGELDALSASISTEVTNRQNAVSTINGRLDVIEGDNTTVGSIEYAKKEAMDAIATEEAARISADDNHSSRLYTIEAGLTQGVKFKNSFATVSDLDALDPTAIEPGWAYYIQDGNDVYVTVDEDDGDYKPSGWAADAGKSFVKTANWAEIAGLVADEEARAIAAEDTKLTKDQNLADLTDVAAARSNLSVYSATEVDNAVTQGGALYNTEDLAVSADKVTLSHAPKNDMIYNFMTVLHVDANDVASQIQVTKDSNDTTGKTWILSPDNSGQFDGQTVKVQYPYIGA